MSLTIYRRGPLRQIVGLSLPAASAGSFSIPREPFQREYAEPKAGDEICDDGGTWWAVGAVGELTEGSWSVTCTEAP